MSAGPQRGGRFAALGNFDGVHRGHRALLAATAAFAAEEGGVAGAATFAPHPRRFFQPDAPPFLLSRPEDRIELLQAAGAAFVETLTFDRALADMTPRAFVTDVLGRRLGLVGVAVGEDFRFGAGRAGDAADLVALAAQAGMAARAVAPVATTEGGKIGSSAIRRALQDGAVRKAADMLGRPWTVRGMVRRGQQLGAQLGFPTANLALGALVEPRAGVYAIRARIEAEADWRDGVANFGRRPTVGGGAPWLEAHIFDFEGDLYDRNLTIAFIDFLRPEQAFAGVEALAAQIAIDSREARARLSAE